MFIRLKSEPLLPVCSSTNTSVGVKDVLLVSFISTSLLLNVVLVLRRFYYSTGIVALNSELLKLKLVLLTRMS